MSNPNLTLKLLQGFAKKNKNPIVDFDIFTAFVKQYADKHVSQRKELNVYSSNTATVLTADLEELATDGTCTLEYEDVNITKIVYSNYLIDSLEDMYREIENNSTIPFPSTDTFGSKLPDSLVKVVNVKTDFVNWLGYRQMSKPIVIRLEFPDTFKNMLIPSTVFFNSLQKLALDKLRDYLRDQSNFNYVVHKMYSIFGKSEVIVQHFLEDIVEKPAKTVETIEKPTEFNFRAWTTLGNLIIHDIKQKASKLAEDVSLCQAVYLLGFYSIYNKGLIQKQKEEVSTVKELDRSLKKAPYFFTLTEIYNMTTGKGIPFSKKMGQEKLNNYLQKKSTPAEKNSLPEIIRLKTHTNKEYYISKDMVLPLALRKVDAAGIQARNRLMNEWMETLRKGVKVPEMKDDEKFAAVMEELVKEEDPFLWTLLRFELLYLLTKESDVSVHTRNEIEALINVREKKLIPLPELLKVERNELVADVRSRLPLWMTTPILRGFVLFCKRFVTGKKKPAKKGGRKKVSAGAPPVTAKTLPPPPGKAAVPEGEGKQSSGQNAKVKLVEFREHINKLQSEYLPAETSVDQTLEGLVDKWNHLIEERARENLVEDVNSAIRDYIRRFKRTLINNPPGRDDLQRIAIKLASQPIFSEIKRKESFWRYIELYLLKILSRE
jgi:hypothetical protein